MYISSSNNIQSVIRVLSAEKYRQGIRIFNFHLILCDMRDLFERYRPNEIRIEIALVFEPRFNNCLLLLESEILVVGRGTIITAMKYL